MTVAERLIAEAAKSSEVEAWISRQILAGQRPSEILAEMDRLGVSKPWRGDGPAGLTMACAVMFALPFLSLGYLLPG